PLAGAQQGEQTLALGGGLPQFLRLQPRQFPNVYTIAPMLEVLGIRPSFRAEVAVSPGAEGAHIVAAPVTLVVARSESGAGEIADLVMLVSGVLQQRRAALVHLRLKVLIRLAKLSRLQHF